MDKNTYEAKMKEFKKNLCVLIKAQDWINISLFGDAKESVRKDKVNARDIAFSNVVYMYECACRNGNAMDYKRISISDGISMLSSLSHATSVENGWYDTPRGVPELIALMHSELSDALEAYRNGNPPDKHLPDRSSLEVELADVIIRVLDAAAYLDLDIGGALVDKMAFNRTRPYRHGGKVA